MFNKARLKIYPDSVLREKSFPVFDFDKNLQSLINAMRRIMYEHKGIGLAAPQIGILKQVIIADVGNGLLTLVNPTILERKGEEILTEGCLSLPGIGVDVPRSTRLAISGFDQSGKAIEMELSGLMARVVQHEIDHLNGVLIIDYQENKKEVV